MAVVQAGAGSEVADRAQTGQKGVDGDRRVEGGIRVGFVVHAMEVAGAETLVAASVRRLAHRIRPSILCLDAMGRLGGELLDEGFEVVCLGRRPGVDLRLVWRLAREVRERRIEVLHAHQYTPFFYSAMARLVPGTSARVILTEHGRHYPDVVSVRRRWANRLFLSRLANAVNACCDFSRRALSEVDGFAGDRIEIVENGVLVENYGCARDRAAVRRALGLDPDRRYVAAIGRFHPVKDQATLLHAFARFAEARKDVDLLLVGDGPLRTKLEGLARELGVTGRVRFMGFRPDVPRILSVVDVFVLTSLSEAASLTLLEAMASALPVVVTAVGGNPEIVRHGVEGLLVPRGDSEAAGVAILRILDDSARARAMGRAGRRRVEERYRLERTIDSYLELYLRLSR